MSTAPAGAATQGNRVRVPQAALRGGQMLKHAIAWPTATLVSDSTRRMRRDCRRTRQNALSLQADGDSPNMSNEGLECWFDRAKPPLLVRSFARLRRIGPPTAGPPLRRCGRRLPGPLEGPSRWGAGALHPVRPSTAQHLSWISARLRDRSTGPFRRKAHSGVGLRPVVPDRRPPRAQLPALRAIRGHRIPLARCPALERKDGR